LPTCLHLDLYFLFGFHVNGPFSVFLYPFFSFSYPSFYSDFFWIRNTSGGGGNMVCHGFNNLHARPQSLPPPVFDFVFHLTGEEVILLRDTRRLSDGAPLLISPLLMLLENEFWTPPLTSSFLNSRGPPLTFFRRVQCPFPSPEQTI